LGEITFRNNKAIGDVGALRGLFPIMDGDIASREKIAKGLENLRKAYGDRGYINFTSVPNTELDDERRLLFLDIDSDEGKQFHMGDFSVVGLDEPTTQELLKDFPMKRGQVYDRRLFESFMLRHPSISAPDDPSRIYRRLEELAGTISTTVDARPCTDCIGPCSLVENRHSTH
jgi:outer membrane protein insertion porin family